MRVAQGDCECGGRILRRELNESRGAREAIASSDRALPVEECARVGLRHEVHERAAASARGRRQAAVRRERRSRGCVCEKNALALSLRRQL